MKLNKVYITKLNGIRSVSNKDKTPSKSKFVRFISKLFVDYRDK